MIRPSFSTNYAIIRLKFINFPAFPSCPEQGLFLALNVLPYVLTSKQNLQKWPFWPKTYEKQFFFAKAAGVNISY